jgi:hypothetical protein
MQAAAARVNWVPTHHSVPGRFGVIRKKEVVKQKLAKQLQEIIDNLSLSIVIGIALFIISRRILTAPALPT